MPELALDDDQRDAFVGHFDRVSVPQLMRREPSTDTSCGGRASQLFAASGLLPVPAGGRTVDYAQQRSDRKPGTDLEPRLQLRPVPAVHANLAALAALATPNEDRAASAVEIGLGEVERFADPQPGAPQDHDERPEPSAVGPVTGERMTATISSTVGGSAG
jgi:hypothetical protein